MLRLSSFIENDVQTNVGFSGNSRRQFFQTAAIVGAVGVMAVATKPALALDMDSFVNKQLEQDKVNCNLKLDPKCILTLSQDES